MEGLGAELGDAGTIETGMGPSEEQGGAQAERGNAVAVSLGGSLDHAVQAESSQVTPELLSVISDAVNVVPSHSSALAVENVQRTMRLTASPARADRKHFVLFIGLPLS